MTKNKSTKHIFFYFVSLSLSSVLLILSLIFNIITIPLIHQQQTLKKEIKQMKTENTKLMLSISEQTRFELIEAFAKSNNLIKPKTIYVINK